MKRPAMGRESVSAGIHRGGRAAVPPCPLRDRRRPGRRGDFGRRHDGGNRDRRGIDRLPGRRIPRQRGVDPRLSVEVGGMSGQPVDPQGIDLVSDLQGIVVIDRGP